MKAQKTLWRGKGKASRIVAAAIIAVLFGVCTVQAETVTLPLDCAGEYGIDTPDWILDFDLGVEFTEISNVYMDWSGEMTAGLFIPAHSTETSPLPSGFSAYMPSPIGALTSYLGGVDTYPYPEPFDAISGFELHSMGPGNWSNLLDGQATIEIGYAEAAFAGSYVESGSAVLDEASLVVDGTVVPEPATLFLLAAVIVAIRRKRRDLKV